MARHRRRGWHAWILAGAVGVVIAIALAGAPNAKPGRTQAPHQEASVSPHPSLPDARPSGQARRPTSVAITHASDRGDHGVDITIDDGPDPRWTPQVLEVLRENGAKATFCMVGTQAQAYPDLVKAVVAAGHRLCNHTASHDTTMDAKPKAYQSQQILDAKRLITQASGGVAPLYYRAPGGAFTPYSRHLAASYGMRPLGWNVDSKDFERPGTNAIVSTVKKEVSNGPTLLFHDGGGDRSQTVTALRKVLPWLKQQGLLFGFPVY